MTWSASESAFRRLFGGGVLRAGFVLMFYVLVIVGLWFVFWCCVFVVCVCFYYFLVLCVCILCLFLLCFGVVCLYVLRFDVALLMFWVVCFVYYVLMLCVFLSFALYVCGLCVDVVSFFKFVYVSMFFLCV